MRIVIASGKGGTGKTTVAVNLASLMAESSDRVCYIDCDVEEPNGHLFLKPKVTKSTQATISFPTIDESLCDGCGKCKEICQFKAITVIAEKVLVFPELCQGCGGCKLICPQKAITKTFREIGSVMTGNSEKLGFIGGKLNVGEPQAVPLIREVKNAIDESLDVIIDAPPGTACPMVETVRGAEYVLLVTEPTPFGLSDLKLAVETTRALGLPCGVVINRADIGDGAVKMYCLDENIPVITEIPEDRQLAELYSRGELIFDSLPRFRKYYTDILTTIEAETVVRKTVYKFEEDTV